MKPRRRWSILLALTLAVTLGGGCSRRESPAEAGIRSQTLLLGNGAEPQDLDPHVVTAYTDQNILLALFEGLTAIDEKTSEPVPAAAESWTVSPDGLTYAFHLRAGLRWSDGEPLTADDFVQSWRRLLSPALAAEYAYLLYPVKNAAAFNAGKIADPAALGFAAPDPHTVVVSLERPTPYLPALTAQPSLFPVNPRVLRQFDALSRRGTDWTRPGNLVGNGPFQLKEWSPNARLVMEKNPLYWDAAKTRLRRIIFYPTENPDVEERDFRAGQLHLTYALPLAKVDSYRRNDPAKLRLDPFLETFFLRFNVTRPPLDQPKVRQALARAIDRTALTRNLLRGSRQPAHSFTPPDCAGYTARAGVPDDFGAARQLLAEAGFPDGRGLPVLEVQVRNDEIHAKTLEAIQAMWRRELGITITIAPVEQKTWVQNQQSLNYAISTARWVGDFVDPVTFLDLFAGGGGSNWTGWANPDYDRLLAQAAATANPRTRYELFQQAEALLLEASPVAPLFFGARIGLIHPAVKNWRPALLGFHRYQFVDLEP
ncbi:MAG: peptide ABC transporter substrate-binding protein [Opitutaceae bacterium]|nr:peptide ABC transporter substrate-binding protein [Opitutaceae bacterium]